MGKVLGCWVDDNVGDGTERQRDLYPGRVGRSTEGASIPVMVCSERHGGEGWVTMCRGGRATSVCPVQADRQLDGRRDEGHGGWRLGPGRRGVRQMRPGLAQSGFAGDRPVVDEVRIDISMGDGSNRGTWTKETTVRFRAAALGVGRIQDWVGGGGGGAEGVRWCMYLFWLIRSGHER